VDTWIETEFIDITSLDMPLSLAAPAERVQALLPSATAANEATFPLAADKPFSIFQLDDQRYSLNTGGQTQQGGRFPGAARATGAKGGVSAVIHECWKRWPKAIDATPQGITVSILPAQPSPNYGDGLPHYLLYPFCEGKYRAKWGMAFDTFVTFDFSGAAPLAELAAEADLPVIAVLPQAWIAQSGALAPMRSAPGFTAWDQHLAASFKAHMERKERDREYGYFNYGDWYGERGRNWGNNEYDTAHGLFMAFAETGHRPYFRAAQAAARHQAATDIVHAYPDPLYVGANRQHSIGHSGISYQHVQLATWSAPDGYTSWASNGHTWAGGMMDAWFLTGEARVMESALALAEHITWAMAPAFTHLGTHERSAGWSLAAITAVYRGVYDPAYLNAARQITAVALREQRFDKGGGWPHVLPKDHARGQVGIEGNNLFLIGVLLNGLHEYYELTRDPAVRKSILAGAEWVAKTWDPKDRGWPYSATSDGQPLGKPTVGVNNLIMASMAIAGDLTGQDRYDAIAAQALAKTIAGGVSNFGKDLSKDAIFAAKTLSLLQRRPGIASNLLESAEAILRDMLLSAPASATHDLRGPEQKVFLVRAAHMGASLTATRAPFGAIPRQKPTGSVRLLDAASKPLAEQTFDTDKPLEFTAQLPPGQPCRLVVSDDMRGVWSVAGKDVQVMFLASPAVHIGGVGRRSLAFLVPKGCKEFSVRLVGVHTGGFSGAVVAPSGAIAAQDASANAGAVLLPGAMSESAAPPAPKEIELRVKPSPDQTGQPWRLCVAAAGDMQCEVKGLPPWLANRT